MCIRDSSETEFFGPQQSFAAQFRADQRAPRLAPPPIHGQSCCCKPSPPPLDIFKRSRVNLKQPEPRGGPGAGGALALAQSAPGPAANLNLKLLSLTVTLAHTLWTHHALSRAHYCPVPAPTSLLRASYAVSGTDLRRSYYQDPTTPTTSAADLFSSAAFLDPGPGPHNASASAPLSGGGHAGHAHGHAHGHAGPTPPGNGAGDAPAGGSDPLSCYALARRCPARGAAASTGVCLRECYAMSGTETAYGGRMCYARSGTERGVCC
eukprot:3736945-Rhodomonas_salina.1